MLFSVKDDGYSHGVAMILSKNAKKSLLGYSPITDRIMKVRLQGKPYNLGLIQCYAPTLQASEEEMHDFYNALQKAVDSIPNRDIIFIMGDLSAKVGKQSASLDSCGIYSLGRENERGTDLIEFCTNNNLVIANTLFAHHPRRLYTWTSPDNNTRNQIDYIIINKKCKASLKNVKNRPGADCHSDHELLVCDI